MVSDDDIVENDEDNDLIIANDDTTFTNDEGMYDNAEVAKERSTATKSGRGRPSCNTVLPNTGKIK